MQLVIDIPEKTVNEIKDNALFAGSILSEIRWDVTSAIVNGTPFQEICDRENGVYKENITIKADKHIKGYSNNFPLLCDLEVIFSNNKEWITLRDNRDNSITVEIKSLIKLLGYGKTIGDMCNLFEPQESEVSDAYTN